MSVWHCYVPCSNKCLKFIESIYIYIRLSGWIKVMDTNNLPNNKKIIIRPFIESIYIFVKFLFFKFFIMRVIIMFPNIHTLQTQWFSWSKPWENGKNKVPLWWTKSVFGICCILILINHGFFIKLVLINSKTLEYEISVVFPLK